MGAHHLGRDHKGGVTLVAEAFDWIEVVAYPDAVGSVEHAEVHAGAAGCAAFDLERGVCDAQFVEETVERLRVCVDSPLASGAGARIDEVAIVIPFEVGDHMVVQECVQPLGDVCECVGMGEVDDLLVASQCGICGAGAEEPIGVCASEVTVWVHHFGFDPESEFHALLGDMVDEGVSPFGQMVSSTCQSPSPAVSSRRPRYQPSSSTKRSTPTLAAMLARALRRARS